eukprot:g270.t1
MLQTRPTTLIVAAALLASQLPAATAAPACNASIDSHDPLHGLVRAGNDFQCVDGVETLDACVSLCCKSDRCVSFSYNDPWTLDTDYMGCKKPTPAGDRSPCCCLKDKVSPLEANKWDMNITTGTRPPPPPAPCRSSLDCNLNGDCDTSTGLCKCDAAWTDFDCGTLNLIPAASLDGAYQHKVNMADCATSCGPSSWGGLPLKVGDTYHLFASQFVQNCTLKGWNRGSTVIRAVADNPMGPFKFAQTVFGTFHHNPTVRRLSAQQSGTGKELFVMFMIGAEVPPPAGTGAACTSSDYNGHHLEGYISIAWAEHIEGPWMESAHAILPSGSPGSWAPLITDEKNSTAMYLFFRGTNWPVDGYERIGLAKAESWKGPYGRVSDQPLWGPVNDTRKFVEDPFVWRSARGVHMLSHGHFDENGYYACAERPEGPWQFRIKPAYTNVVEITNGTKEVLVQRERPQLWFDEHTGAPSILFTGVAPPGASFYGYTYTFAQRIAAG